MENKTQKRKFSILSGLSFLILSLAFIGTYFGNMVKAAISDGAFANYELDIVFQINYLITFAVFLALAVIMFIGKKNSSIIVGVSVVFGYLLASRIVMMFAVDGYFSYNKVANVAVLALAFAMSLFIVSVNVSKRSSMEKKLASRYLIPFASILVFVESFYTIIIRPIVKWNDYIYADIKAGEDFDAVIHSLSALRDFSIIFFALGILFMGIYVASSKKDYE